jgi:hypothetical protein
MAVEHVERFQALFFAGLALMLAGGVNALWRSRADRGGVLFASLACGGLLGGLWLWEPNYRVLGRVAAIMALAAVPCLMAGSERVAAGAARVASLLRRPSARWGLIGLTGLGCVVGSVVRYEAEDDRYTDACMRELEQVSTTPRLGVADHIQVTTDRGTPLALKRPTEPRTLDELLSSELGFLGKSPYRDAVIRRSPADDGANCHGWVFAGGRFWVGPSEVEAILKENGYGEVSDPRPGDLAVYRQGGGVTHTAVVRYVTPGLPVLVEGKWGWSGVYMHPVDQSPYGAEFTYHHSPRGGHTLAGVGDRAPATPPAE